MSASTPVQHTDMNYTLKRRTELRRDDLLVAIMGRSGHGKTSFVRRTAQTFEDVEEVDPINLDPRRTFNFYRLHGHKAYQDRIVLIDTPAFDSNSSKDTKSLADIIKDIRISMGQQTKYKNKKLAGIIYLYAFSEQHNSTLTIPVKEEAPTPNEFKSMVELCDGAYSIHFTTWVWDNYPNKDGQKAIIDDFTAARKAETQGAKYSTFSGDSASAWDILLSILKMHQPSTSNVQDNTDVSFWAWLGKKLKKLRCC